MIRVGFFIELQLTYEIRVVSNYVFIQEGMKHSLLRNMMALAPP